MLEKEAFVMLVKKVWNMLTDNTQFSADVSTVVNKLKPKQFRERVARVILSVMTKELGRTVTPSTASSGEDFIDTVALAFASIAEDDRPLKFSGYTPHAFAEMLIIKFCTEYAVLDERAPTDDVLPDCKVALTIPTCSAEALSLREQLQTMPVTEFGRYAFPN